MFVILTVGPYYIIHERPGSFFGTHQRAQDNDYANTSGYTSCIAE